MCYGGGNTRVVGGKGLILLGGVGSVNGLLGDLASKTFESSGVRSLVP